MRSPYLKWALFFAAFVFLEQFTIKHLSQNFQQSLDSERLVSLLTTLTGGDEPSWEGTEDTLVIPLAKRGGVWVARVAFNNMYEGNLVVDSGASFTTLSEDFAFDLGLTPQPGLPKFPFETANGTTYGWAARVHTLSLGETHRHDVVVAVVDLSNFADKEIDGLLGLNVLNGFDWRLDHQQGYLLLHQKT